MAKLKYVSEVAYSTLTQQEQEKILHLQQSILESVSSGENHQNIIDRICHLEEELLPNSVATVMLMDENYEFMNVCAAPSIPPEGVTQLNGLKPGPGGGSCGNVIYQQAPQFVSNTFTDDRWSDMRHLAHNFNLCSCWSVPVYSQGRIIGTFALSSFEHRSPTPFHRKLLEIGSSIIGIVLDRQKDEAALRIAATAFESQDAMIITDANIRILRTNRAFTEMTGYTTEEVFGQNPRVLSSGMHDSDFYKTLWKSIKETGRWQGEVWNRRKNGEVFPEQLTITAVKNSDGEVINYVGSLTDITLRKNSEMKIQHLANYDHLTELPNRRMFLERLKQALANSVRNNHSSALLFIDLDNFKLLNDTWGHENGDMLLQHIAKRLVESIREGDTVSRIGGDEFVIILENLNEDTIKASEQAKMVAEKIRLIITDPIKMNGHVCICTSSIGISIFEDGKQNADELLKQADIAMYHAKSSGRNTICFFDSRMQDAINARAFIEAELRQALDKKQFQLYYQVQENHLGEVIGAEALIRWVHPKRGLVSPVEFIPIAEETGLILSIGQWVIEAACAQLKEWADNPKMQDLVLAVNVSATQFHHLDFANQVKDTIARYGVAPNLLKLELTESLLLKGVYDTVRTMNTLNEIGVLLSLDDFGTGYSSLQYLRRLPFDQLKIDQTFVRNITDSASDLAITHAIITMAESMNLDVIAEGVETEAQMKLLLEGGCTNYQGYLFSKPLPIEKFESLLADNNLDQGKNNPPPKQKIRL